MKKLNDLLSIALLIAAVVSGTGLSVLAQSGAASSGTAAAHTQTDAERGERAFKANCSRCHYAPDTLNPRITGTVVRHMRVRANLSAADERAILRYLNP